MDVIGKMADLVNELRDLAEKNKANVRVGSNLSEVHIPDAEIFFKYFKQFDIEELNYVANKKFPFEAFVEIDGVRFCTLLTQAEYEIFVLNKEVS